MASPGWIREKDGIREKLLATKAAIQEKLCREQHTGGVTRSSRCSSARPAVRPATLSIDLDLPYAADVPDAEQRSRHPMPPMPMSPDAPDDYDWTLCPGAFEVERQRREKRNVMVKERLQNTNRASYVSSGNSLWPTVSSGHMCVYHPVADTAEACADDQVKEGDIVFCEVQSYSREGHFLFYAHQVLGKKLYGDTYWYSIGNIHGYCNGHCRIGTIYGKLIWNGPTSNPEWAALMGMLALASALASKTLDGDAGAGPNPHHL